MIWVTSSSSSSSMTSIMIIVIISLLCSHSTASSMTTNNNDDVIVLQDFSSSSSSSHHHVWEEMNDPVMGGQSTGSFIIENGIGHFKGHVAIVPFLKAPGFIKAETTTTTTEQQQWPNVSHCQGLQLTVGQSSTSTNEYQGYRVSFGKNRPPDAFPYTYGYKADMKLSSSHDEFTTTDDDDVVVVSIPFSKFTDKWDAGTGNAIVTCEEDSQYCPDQATLENLYSIAIWGEGVEGDVDLQLKRIDAYGCASSSSSIPTTTNELEQQQQQQQQEEEEEEIIMDADSISYEDDSDSNDNDNNNDGTEEEILLEDFSKVTNHWVTMNDPVMGGKSTSQLTIANGVARFEGDVNIVPFLGAPGFITMRAGGMFIGSAKFPDVSHCTAFKMVLRSESSSSSAEDYYKGYRLSFGRVHLSNGHHAYGYKAPAWENVPSDFGSMVFPFDSFSSSWDDATGDIIVPCSEDNPQYCPTKKALSKLQTLSIWGEGVEGKVMLEIKSIHAIGCTTTTTTMGDDSNDKNGRQIYDDIYTSIDENAGLVGLVTALVVLCIFVVEVLRMGYRRCVYQAIKP